MSFSSIQKQINELPAEDQDKLAAYLTVLRLNRNASHVRNLSKKLNDTKQENWLDLQNLKSKLKNSSKSHAG